MTDLEIIQRIQRREKLHSLLKDLEAEGFRDSEVWQIICTRFYDSYEEFPIKEKENKQPKKTSGNSIVPTSGSF